MHLATQSASRLTVIHLRTGAQACGNAAGLGTVTVTVQTAPQSVTEAMQLLAIHEDTFKKRQFGVLHLQCTGITIAPCDRTCNTGSWRFIFMTVRMEKYWLLIFSFHRFPWTWSTFQTNLIFKKLFAVSNCPCVQGLFPAVSSGPLHYPMVRIVKFKRQNSKLWCYIWISVGFIPILGIIYFLLKGRGE